jgi:hypothetical protein
VDYSVTANKAILDLASRNRDAFLWNFYRMGRDMIDRGNTDSWIVTPKVLAEAEAKLGTGGGRGRGGAALDAFANADFGGRGGGGGALTKEAFTENFRNPAKRAPRAYILPSNQPDFLTAQKFLVALQKAGIIVHRAPAAFTIAGKNYPAGSYVVKSAQAFRAHVLDMFEPQDHPNDFAYPGAPPSRPYDNAGWTLAMQMGVKFDRILDGFDVPALRKLDPITDRIKPDPTTLANTGAGWVISPRVNDSFHAVARLWAAGADVYRTERPTTVNGVSYPAGSFFIPANARSTPVVQKSAVDLGVTFASTTDMASASSKVPPVRIGLWDRYGGSMPSGHMRWLMEQYEMPFKVVYPAELDAGNLRAKFDVLIFPENSVPALAAGGGGGRGGRGGGGRGGGAAIPAELQHMAGTVSVGTMARLREFVQQGGRLVAIGESSLNTAQHFGFPITDHLVERTPTGSAGTPLPSEKFYVPGSILEVAYDTTSLAARGQEARGPVFFDNSPVMRLGPDAAAKGVKPIAWFDTPTPLRSGWAWGQNYLDGGVAMAEGKYGQGTVYMFGPEITFRAQPAATFKLLFNSVVGDGRPNIVP